MADHLDLGRQGEEAACQYLLQQGYQVVKRNWKHQHLEIDLIANIADELVFVEVKTRSTAYFGHPAESITETKKERLFRAAEIYLENQEEDWECRFDVIAVVINKGQVTIDHMVDAIQAEF